MNSVAFTLARFGLFLTSRGLRAGLPACAVLGLFYTAGCGIVGGEDTSRSGDVPVRYGAVPEGDIRLTPPRKPDLPQPAPAPAKPFTLVGLAQGEIEAELGAPSGVRDRNPALVYEYRTAGCALDVVLFMDIERKEYRALSYDIRAAGADDDKLANCIRALKVR